MEEKLLDALLANAGSEVFTSTRTYSHGTAQGRLTATEQVMGRSRAVQIQVIVAEDALSRLTALLCLGFQGTGLRYWVTALHTEGYVL